MAPVCGVESKIGLAGGHSFALRAELPKYIRRAGTTNGTSRKTPDVCGRLVSTYSGQSSAGQSVAFYGSRCIFSTSTRAGSNRFNVQWQRSLSTAGLVLRHGQIAAKLAMGTTRLESFTLLSIVLSKPPYRIFSCPLFSFSFFRYWRRRLIRDDVHVEIGK